MRFLSFLHDNARWLTGGFLLTLFSSYGQTFYIALSSGGIREELGLSHGDFGWIYMLATLLSAAMIPFTGRLADTMRIERYAIFVIVGLALSMLLLAHAHHVAVLFVALAALRMFGQGLMGHTAMTAMGRWFTLTRGKAVSTAALGHQLGESVMPISFVALAAAYGWRDGWSLNAGFLLLCVLPAVHVLMRVPREPHPSEKEKLIEGRQWTRGELIRDPLFWPLIFVLLAPPVIGTVIFFHQVYLAELRGWALGQFAGSTPVLSVAAIAMTFVSGQLIDKYHSAVLLPAMLVFTAIANLALALVPGAWAIVIFMAFMGGAFGIYATVFGAIWPELYGTRHLAAIKSMVTSIMVFSTAVGPGLSGWLIDLGVAYPVMIAAMASYALLAAIAAIFIARVAGLRLA
ncbi:MFS transporter [Pseudohoeflea suaedae]|uniref:MFS transporter n=1 Tax=Pseudohoeflea suaedae TaxID=877384 RepID=A0A4R5PK73_9HYPH|nr:MFS transporter [Pseudohoeflea suaedae]TDH36026.1 MFS transporter [Pseudohoeflea suaedae]